MDLETLKTAMLATGSPHHAHRGFADAVEANIVSMPESPPAIAGTILEDTLDSLRTSLPDYDIYLLEGSGEVYSTPRIKLTTDASVVYVCDDHRLYGTASYDLSSGSILKTLAKRIDRKIDATVLRTLVSRYVDGVIAGSGFVADVARNAVGPDTPVRVASPYIQPDVFERLGTVDPALTSNVAVTVGIGRDHKGVDFLVDAWPSVREHVSDAELRVVGPGHSKDYEEVPGVEVLGYVKPHEIHEVLAPCSLYVHPARAEAFGVTVVEAMRAGLPAIVTRTTGARSAVREVDGSLIVDPTPEALAQRVTEYFDNSSEVRRDLSERARAEGSTHDAESGQRTFRQQFESVLQSIDE